MRDSVFVRAIPILLMLSPFAIAVNFQTAGPVDSTADSDGLNKFDRVPRVATDGAGHWVAVWETSELASGPNPVDLDIAVSRSSDNGATWSTPSHVAKNAGIDDAFPAIATDGNGTWVCAYTSQSVEEPYHRAVQTCKSTDNGATWSPPVDANPSDPIGPYVYSPSIAADTAGNWVLVWSTTYTLLSDPDPLVGDDDIAVSTSPNGTDWSAPARVNSAYATDDLAGDAWPQVATDDNGVWVCVWRSTYKPTDPFHGDDDIYFSRSTTNGATWTAQSVLHPEFDTETFSDEYPRVAADGNGSWMVTWEAPDVAFGVDKVWTSVSMDDGMSWSPRKRVSDEPPLGDSQRPVVASGGNGEWLVVWSRHLFQKGGHSDYDIAKSETSDDGDNWTAVENLNSNATDDLGDDRDPDIATDGAGHWVVLWGTEDTEHSDQDVWRAISGGAAGSLTLTVPNGGEKWRIGTKHAIEWNSSGNVGANVKLELLRNGGVIDVIKASTPNDGKQKWKLPNSLSPGGGYKVRVTSKSDGAIRDTGDGAFKVKEAK
ncbi:MAG: exo-alpha-sialidase [Candidatus Hydrogenedentes bacterium]|nr:exo-alpha-sialidase [Candidatus Hydrogenedentota bacterium]